MNLRDIKKDIEYVLGAFIDDCSVFATVNQKVSDDELAGLFEEAVSGAMSSPDERYSGEKKK